MVSETLTETQVDPNPAETQTETPAEEAPPEEAPEPESAAGDGEEVATVPVIVPTEPASEPERWYTEAEAREIARQERDAYQARVQAENGRRAWQQQQDAEQRAERLEAVEAQFAKAGYTDVSPEFITQILDRNDNKRQGQWLDHAQTLATQALGALAETVQGRQPVISDQRVQRVYDVFEPAMDLAYQAGLRAAKEDTIPKSELDKHVKAEIARQNQKAREGQRPIQRTEGAPVTSSVMTWSAYMSLSDTEKLAMPIEKRREIEAADAKRRAGQ